MEGLAQFSIDYKQVSRNMLFETCEFLIWPWTYLKCDFKFWVEMSSKALDLRQKLQGHILTFRVWGTTRSPRVANLWAWRTRLTTTSDSQFNCMTLSIGLSQNILSSTLQWQQLNQRRMEDIPIQALESEFKLNFLSSSSLPDSWHHPEISVFFFYFV